MTKVKATRKEVRQARAFLYGRGIEARNINPQSFADYAKQKGITFGALFDLMQQIAENR